MPGGRPTAYQPENVEIARHACMFWLRNRRPEEWRENRPFVNEDDGEEWGRLHG